MNVTTSDGRGAAAAARLAEIAGPDLYRHNAFRITGLPTDVARRTVRERRQQVYAALDVGAPVVIGSDLPPPVRPTDDQIRTAFDDLGDAQRRLVDEIFWLWDTPDPSCPCDRTLHRDHDVAVRTHAQVLDLELTAAAAPSPPDQLWINAAARWSALLRRETFWAHVRHRLHALGDRRLDESTIAALRNTLPGALLATVVTLAATAEDPARLATHAARWDVGSDVHDMLAEAATPLLKNLTTLNDQAGEQQKAGQTLDAITALRTAVCPALDRLEGLAPHQAHRSTASVRNDVAVVFNNCAVALMDDPGSGSTDEIRGLLDTALALALRPETRETIENNKTHLTTAPPTPAQPARGWTVRSPRPLSATATRHANLTFWNWYCLIRLMLHPVLIPAGTFGQSAVGRWANDVIARGDGRKLYLLLRVWHMQTDDPRIKRDLHHRIVEMWAARIRATGDDVGGLVFLGVVSFGIGLGAGGWAGVLVVLAVGFALVGLVAAVIVDKRIGTIRDYFPDFPDFRGP